MNFIGFESLPSALLDTVAGVTEMFKAYQSGEPTTVASDADLKKAGVTGSGAQGSQSARIEQFKKMIARPGVTKDREYFRTTNMFVTEYSLKGGRPFARVEEFLKDDDSIKSVHIEILGDD